MHFTGKHHFCHASLDGLILMDQWDVKSKQKMYTHTHTHARTHAHTHTPQHTHTTQSVEPHTHTHRVLRHTHTHTHTHTHRVSRHTHTPHTLRVSRHTHNTQCRDTHTHTTECREHTHTQWWSVTKLQLLRTVLKYIFQVSVLYWSSFILSNFYFYFTTFQSIRSYFYFTTFHKHIVTRDTPRAPRRRSGVWFMNKLILFNEPVQSFANRHKRFLHELQWSDCSCSRVENSLIQMIRLERVFFSELNSRVKNGRSRERARAQARNSCCEKYVTNVEF